MKHDYDLLIAGGGLAGGSLALALRDAPLRIAIIEAVPEAQRLKSSAGDRALALSWGTAQILEQIGVWREARKKAAPIRHIHVSDRGHFGKVRMSAEKEGVPALGYVAPARVLEESVAEALRDSGIARLCPARVVGLKADENSVHASLKQGEESLNLSAKLLVGADGGESTIRNLLEIGRTVREYGQTAIVTEVAVSRDSDFTAFERFTPSGPLAFLPVEKKRYSVVWTRAHADAEELLGVSEREFAERLQAGFGYWLGRISLTARRLGFPLKLIRARRMIDRRVVLIGNAMHQLHPVAGQGFNLGLRDAAALAEMASVRLGFGEDIGAEAFLQSYAKARADDLNKVIGFTDGMVRIFSNDFAPLVHARNLGMLALDRCPPAKRILARHAMGLGNRLPRFE
jgi:2-octaprenyl-6-methoxyphenol hydroxylase